ncbi:phage shock protein pspC [Micromonospora sp. ATCC 39149]|uniref:PspC domain-containing protein n=1 Tax=Micromonospora sp. (strain ATCC 39149 / NRRL 15099 / SCC 1413) TaxID=219305 RepID=UPI0001A50E47|nr:PspC domain-containing protein [Micromonospora sp. ATCC 39149]EEP71648.1 phage shock protein pspC [Micromonospora sp. ATCC 39149]
MHGTATPPPGGDGPGAGSPPPSGYGAPPPEGAGFTSRYGLVRPREGRYLAGVCAAIGRATNTDPVLWRVLLAVLGFFGGIGILVYVTAWLIIPGEGDTASPVESMLGRGRSSMSPVTVIVLSILVAVSFGYIVTDAFRAVLLGAAILIGGALLLNRDHTTAGRRTPPGPAPGPGAPATAPPGPVPPAAWPAPGLFTPPAGHEAAPRTPSVGPPVPGQPSGAPLAGQPAGVFAGHPFGAPSPGQPAAGWAAAGWAAAPGRPPAGATAGLPAWPPAPDPSAGFPPPLGAPVGSYPPVAAPTPPGYRPPFAPHGPYAKGPQPAPPPPLPPAKPPKQPKERSPLGAVTFSLIFLALGVVAVLDLLDVVEVGAAAYFAAALATIGLGLLVGTWFGRARWLIALGLVTAAALGVATVAESYDRVRGVEGDVTWAPTDRRDVADRYENNFGDAVLDLRAIDFDKQETQITVAINFGHATVVVPPNVDVTTLADVNAGDATIFGNHSEGLVGRLRESTDLGADGAGGGKLRLYIHVNAGDLEVTR